ncbi:exosortase/archaeosortase family protein [Geothermobacter hydrogeniphilus]|uniref:Exosortase n=1 Tax=Geothermobacter hydrogeniphilus TaxID=1969733 RepID=A0A1X0YE45_9BACT|nr:exosortase/archaeosortase family protein [Geothermobacter hydrogeniphilus]ORJ63389.1 exosortase [Geothermobacter hydrogeniphilus]
MGNRTRTAILLILLAAVFYPVYPELFSAWIHQADSSHGLLVPLVSLYFVWTCRERLKQAETSSSAAGLVLLSVSLIVYLLALVGDIAVVARAMIVFSLAGLVLYLYGGKVFRILAFPLFFLLFMVPVPVSIIGLVALPLQTLATMISSSLIQLCSIPVLREGNMLYFVQTQLEVAEACSGIRSIVALIMLGTVFVYFSKLGTTRKIILLCSAVPVAMVANILRISGTGILAHFYGDQVARGFLHEFSGLAVFMFGLLVLGMENVLLSRGLRFWRPRFMDGGER